MNQMPYYDQLLVQLRWQAQKITELDAEVQQLKKNVADLQTRRQIHVEKIEYKFDQLKIETLEGTLNIGISPSGGKQIEEMIVADKEIELTDPGKLEMVQDIKDRADQYLASDCIRDLQQFEANHQVILGQAYREEIIKDIRNQVDQRIQFYLDHLDAENQPKSADGIFDRLKRDIQIAMERHVVSKKQGGNPNENGG